MKQKLKTGAEYDLLSGWRHLLCYMKRAGVKKSVKRQLSRRRRREASKELRELRDG